MQGSKSQVVSDFFGPRCRRKQIESLCGTYSSCPATRPYQTELDLNRLNNWLFVLRLEMGQRPETKRGVHQYSQRLHWQKRQLLFHPSNWWVVTVKHIQLYRGLTQTISYLFFFFCFTSIAQMGVGEGKPIGQWYGPNTVAQVLK